MFAFWSTAYQRPLTLTACLSPLGSVDGLTLQIDELKGTTLTEKIDLSDKKLGAASAIIIASCIKENGVLMELKCAAASKMFAFLSAPSDTLALSLPPPHPSLAVSIKTISGTRAHQRSLPFSRRRRSPTSSAPPPQSVRFRVSAL